MTAAGSQALRRVEGSRPPLVEASATRVVISIFGVLAGLAAIEHGIGEISQGSARPPSLLIESWPNTPAFAVLGGEPALTVLPTFLVGGIVTMIIAVALCIWAIAFAQRRGGGLVLILLSAMLLLTSGGFGPPLIGVILGVAALRMGSAPRDESRQTAFPLARAWPWILAIGVAGYLALVPGTVVLYHFAGVANDTVVYALILISFAALILSLLAAQSVDRRLNRQKP